MFEKGLCYVKLYKNNIHISNFLYTHNINFLVIQIPNFQHSIYFTTRNKSDAVFHLRASRFSHKPNQTSLYFLLLLIHFLILISNKSEDIQNYILNGLDFTCTCNYPYCWGICVYRGSSVRYLTSEDYFELII